MVTILNTRKCWAQLYHEYLCENRSDSDIVVQIDNHDPDSMDISCLCYSFLIERFLAKKKKITGLKVNVQVVDKDFTETLSRLSTYLSQIEHFSTIQFLLNNNRIYSRDWETSRIAPVFYADNVKHNYVMLKDRFALAVGRDSQNQRYSEILSQQFSRIQKPEIYQGSKENKLSRQQKEKFRDEICANVEAHLHEMNVLSMIIWLFLLRELIETKFLFLLSDDQTPQIKMDLLNKSRMDAIAYSECMYQLIENACLHSSGKCAWFGFRVYHAGRALPISQQLDEAETRNRLYRKYRDCIATNDTNHLFNQDLRYFFEFYVVDNASCHGGILTHHNHTVFASQRDAIWHAILKEKNERDQGGKPLTIDALEQKYPCPSSREQAYKDFPQVWQAKESALGLHYLSSINELFRQTPRNDQLEHYIEDLTIHYGLPLLQRIVEKNKGYVRCTTADDHSKTLVFAGLSSEEVTPSAKPEWDWHITEWNVLLPITNQWEPYAEAESTKHTTDQLLISPLQEKREHLYIVDLKKIDRFQQNKAESIDILANALKQVLPGITMDKLQTSIIAVRANGDLREVELLAKALLKQLAKTVLEEDSADSVKDLSLRIAILLPNLDLVHEFIRLFSVFYRKGHLPLMQNVQIAVCSPSSSNRNDWRVRIVLAGEMLGQALSTARHFAYHYSREAIEQLPLLSYLVEGSGHEDPIALFPFDLYLPETLSEESIRSPQKLNIWKDSWFLSYMNRLLNSNIQENQRGCLVKDVHIRLGSKIHLEQFYEGELLFHDTSITSRMAYLFVHDIYTKNPLKPDRLTLLIGYEKYSANLIMQVRSWLREKLSSNLLMAVVYDDTDEDCVRIRWHDRLTSSERHLPIQMVTIVPTGTTLSTVYKVQNTVFLNLKNEYFSELDRKTVSYINYCMLLIGNESDNDDGSLSDITSRYWQKQEQKTNRITVQPDVQGHPPAQVKYLLLMRSTWHSPDNCPLCNRDETDLLPLIDAKHSNMVAGAIFPLNEPHAGHYELLPKAQNELGYLWQTVIYSHLCSKANHFQYFIDFAGFFSTAVEEKVRESLRKISIERNAFHVVISPLQNTNSPFVKAVIDEVFGGRVRFLCFGIGDAFREDVRAKFSYISQDYLMLKQTNPEEKMHIHFVDNSIISGSNLNRARLLIQMLLEQSRIPYHDVALFDRVFLLVNRCSYDTINSFVAGPVETKFFAYMNLAIPSYNTEQDFCPACRQVSRYGLLEKRSSTRQLAAEFSRLVEKHKKRTQYEYISWLDENIMNSHAIYGWIKQWLYVCVIDRETYEASKQEGISSVSLLSFLCELSEARYNESNTPDLREQELELANKLRDEIEEYETALKRDLQGTICLKDVLAHVNDENMIKSIKGLISLHLVQTRDYMRLWCMHKAYVKLEGNFAGKAPESAAEYEKQALELISKELVDITDSDDLSKSKLAQKYPWLFQIDPGHSRRFAIMYNIEWLVSYIKVLSREQIVNYYSHRRASVNIMNELLMYVIEREKALLELKKVKPRKTRSRFLDSKLWKKIRNTIDCIYDFTTSDQTSEGDAALYSLTRYQLQMLLIHRLADLQMSTIFTSQKIADFFAGYVNDAERFSKANPLPVVYPTKDQAIMRYLKAVKTATMTVHDDIPCLKLARVPFDLQLYLSDKKIPELQRELLERIARYLYLENTQFLYSGMRELQKLIDRSVMEKIAADKSFTAYSDRLKEMADHVNECLRNSYVNVDAEAKEEDLLYQSVLGNFCRYWHISRLESPLAKGGAANRIAYILRYFLLIDDLYVKEDKDIVATDLPYRYEEICRAICSFTGYKMCYLVHKSLDAFPAIFAQSGYYTPYLENDLILTVEQAGKIIEMVSCGDQSKQGGLTIQRILPCLTHITMKVGEGTKEYLTIALSANDVHVTENSTFYIILQAEGEKKNTCRAQDKPGNNGNNVLPLEELCAAQEILFVRKRLQKVLLRDYATLISFRFDCSYIRRLNKEEEDFPSILHLSDLHVTTENLPDEKMDKITDKIKVSLTTSSRKRIRPELLVITGDVVDGRAANAPDMESNYQTAAKLLTKIVITLWKEDDDYLPHDWKRRVLITTGNHDFASMNQYVANLKRRALVAGTPVETSSGTMSRFTGFIDFLIRFLDLPVDKMLINSLNEVRHYDGLHMKVMLLNCSDTATALRTNKIGINAQKVEELAQSKTWTSDIPRRMHDDCYRMPFKLCLAHYTPNYDLSYFFDMYSVLPGWDWTPINNCPVNALVNDFLEAMKAELRSRMLDDQSASQLQEQKVQEEGRERTESYLKTRRQEFKARFDDFARAIQNLLDGKQPEETEQTDTDPFYHHYKKLLVSGDKEHNLCAISEEAKKYFSKQLDKNDLYLTMKLYLEWLKQEKPDNTDERISRMIYDVNESVRMSEIDKRTFRKNLSPVIGKLDTVENETHTGEREGKEEAYVDLYLAGHIHAYAHDKERAVMVSDKLYKPNSDEVNGYLIYNMKGRRLLSQQGSTADEKSYEFIRLNAGKVP